MKDPHPPTLRVVDLSPATGERWNWQPEPHITNPGRGKAR